jgi:hypothetical protein
VSKKDRKIFLWHNLFMKLILNGTSGAGKTTVSFAWAFPGQQHSCLLRNSEEVTFASAGKPAIIESMSDRVKEKAENRHRNEFWERVRSGKFFEDTDRVAKALKELNDDRKEPANGGV